MVKFIRAVQGLIRSGKIDLTPCQGFQYGRDKSSTTPDDEVSKLLAELRQARRSSEMLPSGNAAYSRRRT